jgi:hypothetical protein
VVSKNKAIIKLNFTGLPRAGDLVRRQFKGRIDKRGVRPDLTKPPDSTRFLYFVELNQC